MTDQHSAFVKHWTDMASEYPMEVVELRIHLWLTVLADKLHKLYGFKPRIEAVKQMGELEVLFKAIIDATKCHMYLAEFYTILCA